ncbi:bestrophin family protein [Pseudoduganella sp. OTU4001]|uniref:bestrophin family protein n=1 Tax=Pseudoduganella sp. OTU4001 TaxID=3043854 RepID=UPI00313EAFD6
MIIRSRDNWFRMLLAWHGSVLPSILPQLGLMLAVSMVALLGHGQLFGERVPLDTAPFSLLGVSLAIFLAFRNNASYQRYLEARQLWGRVLVAARALVSQTQAYLPAARFDHRLCAHQVIVFTHLLRHHLRGSDARADIERLLGAETAERLLPLAYRPITILSEIRAALQAADAAQPAPGQLLWMMDAQVNALGEAVGGCERIASTPVPYPYAVLLHRTIYLYCFLLPFGLVHAIGTATPLMAVFVAYTLFALEAIAQEIGDPFGDAPNALALEAICRSIERSVLEMIGEQLPPELAAGKDFRVN